MIVRLILVSMAAKVLDGFVFALGGLMAARIFGVI